VLVGVSSKTIVPARGNVFDIVDRLLLIGGDCSAVPVATADGVSSTHSPHERRHAVYTCRTHTYSAHLHPRITITFSFIIFRGIHEATAMCVDTFRSRPTHGRRGGCCSSRRLCWFSGARCSHALYVTCDMCAHMHTPLTHKHERIGCFCVTLIICQLDCIRRSTCVRHRTLCGCRAECNRSSARIILPRAHLCTACTRLGVEQRCRSPLPGLNTLQRTVGRFRHTQVCRLQIYRSPTMLDYA
jgi:hypothetical protein